MIISRVIISVCASVCVFLLISAMLCECVVWYVCLMCVSRKINTAKLRKINKCQRSTRSLSHLTIITLIWDMLTNLLCPHLHSTVDSPRSTVDTPNSTISWLQAWSCFSVRSPTGFALRQIVNVSALCCRCLGDVVVIVWDVIEGVAVPRVVLN